MLKQIRQKRGLMLAFLAVFLIFSFQAASAIRGSAQNTNVTGVVGGESAAHNGSSQSYDLRLGVDSFVAKGAGGAFSVYLGWLRTIYSNYSAVILPPTSNQTPMLYASIVSPLSAAEGGTLSFTARVLNNMSESVVGISPLVSVSPAGKAAGLVTTPSSVAVLPSASYANFTVNFSYSATGAVAATFSALGAVLSSGAQVLSNAVTTQLYMGNQFTISLSSGKLEILPKGGASITVLARNTAPFAREKVRLKLSDTACCSFSLTPNGVDIPAGSGATFTLTVSPVSTAQPGTSYTTGIIAYTDTEPSIAMADLAVTILRDVVPETGAARERALNAIRNANDTILFVDTQIAGAEKQRLDTYQAATALIEARKLYKEALALMDSSDYDSAYLKATDAATRAQGALVLIPFAKPAAGQAVTREQAETYIRAANDTIFFVDTQIAKAERQKVPLQEAVGKLAEARGLVKRAQSALSAGDYKGAADLALQATTLARSALQAIPKPGQISVTKTAIAVAAIFAIAAIVYFKFVRKPPVKPAQQYPYPQGYYYQPPSVSARTPARQQ